MTLWQNFENFWYKMNFLQQNAQLTDMGENQSINSTHRRDFQIFKYLTAK